MNKKRAAVLWQSILDFANASAAFESEGNSGEFHNSDEYTRLSRALVQVTKKLVLDFERVTGWTPTLHAWTPKQKEHWTLEKPSCN